MRRSAPLLRALAPALSLAALLGGAGCGSGGGSGAGEPGLVLVSFQESSEDNVALNRVLQFDFSGPVDVDTIGPASIQIRSGPAFGRSVEGRYVVEGSRVLFEPRLPGTCTLADSGFQPDTDYRVTLIGDPEEFAIRNPEGDPLERTTSFSFHTRSDTDPVGLYEDQIPGVAPTVVAHTPRDGAHPPVDPEVNIGPGNKVTIDFSENIDPCTISATTVLFQQVATGNRADFPNGFDPDSDQTPGDPYTWGSGTATTPRQRVRAQYVLTQTFLSTRLEIVPDFGEFPDNALLVVEVTNDVRDFGGNPLVPVTFAFVTENRAEQCKSKTLRFDGDVPVDEDVTTADVDTARAPDRAQGFLLFAGDGDNGANLTQTSGPSCGTFSQPNDGTPDDLDTPGTSDVVLDTGASENTSCNNTADGSRAVVFEYRTFRIRTGRTVRVIGKNPAIILVRGDVLIEQGGRLLVKSDGTAGPATASGGTGAGNPPAGSKPAGGTGVAGGGGGGKAENGGSGSTGLIYSDNGAPGFGSPHYLQPPGMGGTDPVRVGAGRGNVDLASTGNGGTDNKAGAGGGGGGHAAAGGTGASTAGGGTTPRYYEGPLDGAGGGTYGDVSGKMPTPEAGSGGGGAGYVRNAFTSGSFYTATGGGGGAGGGFVDLTAGGNIKVLGTIDASGGMGGGGAAPTSFRAGSGGGGGGSGGGVRLLTPGMIEVGVTTTITTGPGTGGSGVGITGGTNTLPGNNGGVGGVGRVVFEDDDSVITGYAGAVVIPAETSPAGFYRGVFDATRFQGGGVTPTVVTGVIDIGPTNPRFLEPVQTYGVQEDFRAGIPNVSSLGVGRTGILVEVQGFPVKPDGTPDTLAPTGWKRIGYFTDSGSETFPTWNAGTPPDVPLPSGSGPGGFAAVNGNEFVQFRITFYLRDDVGPFDPGPYVDDWTLHFCYDQ